MGRQYMLTKLGALLSVKRAQQGFHDYTKQHKISTFISCSLSLETENYKEAIQRYKTYPSNAMGRIRPFQSTTPDRFALLCGQQVIF